jgi:hypothetical protein
MANINQIVMINYYFYLKINSLLTLINKQMQVKMQFKVL